MNKPAKDLLQETTPEIIELVRAMIVNTRHATLGVLEKGSGHPAVSRVAIAARSDGTPILLTSALAAHTAALAADSRCSLLIGDIGKGDPMAHPRLTMFCEAIAMPRSAHKDMRDRFLAHHPKAINYIDLPDFGFWQLSIDRISYNAGFGKAYAIAGEELISSSIG